MACAHSVVDFDPETEEWFCLDCGDTVPEPDDYDPEDFNDEEEF